MSNRLARIAFAVVAAGSAVCPAAACSQAPAASSDVPQLPSVTLPPEIDRVLRDYEKGWRARDANQLANVFTSDGFVMQLGRPPVRGTEAIKRAYAGSGGNLYLRAIHYEASDTVGFILGAFTFSEGAPDRGKFILAIRREKDGPWKIVADMDSPSAMPGR